jgi:hypothetical protein
VADSILLILLNPFLLADSFSELNVSLFEADFYSLLISTILLPS